MPDPHNSEIGSLAVGGRESAGFSLLLTWAGKFLTNLVAGLRLGPHGGALLGHGTRALGHGTQHSTIARGRRWATCIVGGSCGEFAESLVSCLSGGEMWDRIATSYPALFAVEISA